METNFIITFQVSAHAPIGQTGVPVVPPAGQERRPEHESAPHRALHLSALRPLRKQEHVIRSAQPTVLVLRLCTRIDG